MFWRFFAAADPTIERFISRDVDSRLMARDAAAVDLWVRSGRPFHIVRDHPSHSRYPMSGGLWGCTRGALPNIMQQIDDFPADSNYLTDMNFLNEIVWPIAQGSALQHDSFSCDVFAGASAYPVPRDPQGYHVGQVFDENGQARAVDVDMLMAAVQPAACAPGGNPAAAPPAAQPFSAAEECRRMQQLYQVKPGSSWGGLPAPLEPRWKEIQCDRHLSTLQSAAGKGGAGQRRRGLGRFSRKG